MTARFNPPPSWPAPPAGFTPGPGWKPDPSWPAPPPGWVLWVEHVPAVQTQAAAPAAASTAGSTPASGSPPVLPPTLPMPPPARLAGKSGGRALVAVLAATAVVLAGVIGIAAVGAAGPDDTASAAGGAAGTASPFPELTGNASPSPESTKLTRAELCLGEDRYSACMHHKCTPLVGKGCDAPPKPVHYRTLTSRQWKKIARNPDGHIGEHIVVYGEVTQADAATGDTAFRADVDADRSSCSYGVCIFPTNTVLDGSRHQVGKVVEDDEFRAEVTVTGSLDYETTLGGTMTVPELKIHRITRV